MHMGTRMSSLSWSMSRPPDSATATSSEVAEAGAARAQKTRPLRAGGRRKGENVMFQVRLYIYGRRQEGLTALDTIRRLGLRGMDLAERAWQREEAEHGPVSCLAK